MKKKFLRYFSIFMCEAYFVSLFLPIQLTPFGKTVLGMNFLFIPLMGGEIPDTYVFSLLMAVIPLFALFTSLGEKTASVDCVFKLCAFLLARRVFRLFACIRIRKRVRTRSVRGGVGNALHFVRGKNSVV